MPHLVFIILHLRLLTQTGCTNSVTAPIPVRVVKTPEINFTQLHDGCAPLSMDFHGQLINPDTSAITWQWTFSNGLQSNSQNPSALVFATAGVYSAQAIAINSSGCRILPTVQLEAFGIPVVNAGCDQEYLQGSGKVLRPQVQTCISGRRPQALVVQIVPHLIATPDSAITLYCHRRFYSRLHRTDIVKVTVNYPFNMQNSPGDTLCKGQSAILSASGAASYAWSPSLGLNTTSGNTVTATPANTTHYRVIGYDGKNCFTDTAYFMVKVYPIPTVTAGADRTINVGQTITLTPTISSDVTNVVWSPTTGLVSNNYPSVTVRPTMDMEYKATVTNAGGCTASDIMSIHVLCNGANVFIPNTFSPNGDGANDIFYTRGTGLFTIKQARIFNRWGEEVYAKYNINANDANAGWDGTHKGQKLTPDVYVYMFEIQCENNTTMIYKGNVALIR